MSVTLKNVIKWCIKGLSDKRNMWVVDTLLVFLSYLMVEVMVFSVSRISTILPEVALYLVYVICVYLLSFFVTNNYRVIWQHATFPDYIKTCVVCIVVGIVMAITSAYLRITYFYVKSSFFAALVAMFLLVGYRATIKLLYVIMKQYLTLKENEKLTRVLVVGAGAGGSVFVNYASIDDKANYNIVGFIDDDPSKRMAHIGGTKVLGTRDDIPKICKKYSVDEILIAIPSLDIQTRKEIIDICTKTECSIKIMPTIDSMAKDSKIPEIRTVNIEDLLARDPIILDDNGISENISGKTVLVTGGGGSIGSELCRQLIKYKPALLIILDIYENNAYDLQNELITDYPEQELRVVIASVRDKARLDSIFTQFRPNIVFHAAAHKHVPLMEFSPSEAIKNNVFGTYNVARCADEHGVEKFVMISTDKAVNPTNVMGATKRMCEMIVQAMQKVSKTQFVAVRFGNVLGSNGSVIPLFKKQIANGGPVTVTHKDITRFFMTIPEAAQLVIQASCFARGGEIFVLDMGKPIKIYDLAQNIIRLSGLVPNKDIKIEITGLRSGEKLYEELLMSEEGLGKTRHSKIYIGKPLDIEIDEINSKLDKLETVLETNDNNMIRACLTEVVPTYTPDKSLLPNTAI